MRILGSKRGAVIGGWRKLHNEKVHTLQSSQNYGDQMKGYEMGGTCGTHRANQRREDNIKINIKHNMCGLDSNDQGRIQWWALVNTVVNLLFP
jgi:hypothetical protein